MSKIKNLKAIHNRQLQGDNNALTGFSVSKIKNLKAIHNLSVVFLLVRCTGFSVSKIKNLKAIHNDAAKPYDNNLLVSACQR